MKNYKLEYQIYNNRIKKRIEAEGITVAELCRRSGANQVDIGKLLKFKVSPFIKPNGIRKGGGYRKSVIQVAKYWKVKPEELFPEELYLVEASKTNGSFEFNYGECDYLMGQSNFAISTSPEELLMLREKCESIEEKVKTLNNRSKNMLERHIDGEALDGIGKDYGISRERVRQIIDNARRKIARYR